MTITGAQLRVGDSVMTEPDHTGKRKVAEHLTAYEGKCDQCTHFRTARGTIVCYDNAAILVIAS